ncbi:MAG: Lrp/AsnC family transcriptional regulator [Propionibacteriaceae bacterium]|jgi:DNA-binding Lrp family transcriptional regulator|nr:Lrp/AsnC family transcriptional regulator [Propionibacteriaceae bacterium]
MTSRARDLDATDQRLIELLVANGRMSNHALAEIVGVSESACHARVRALIEAGVIEGFQAKVNSTALGRPLQAVVLVKLQAGARSQLVAESRRLTATDGVVEVLFLTGAFDLMIQVAVPSPAALRDFVIRELNASPAVAVTETSVVMERSPGRALKPIIHDPDPPPARRRH